MMNMDWLAVKLVTGTVMAELPTLQCTKLEYRIGEMTSSDAVLPWDDRPKNWYDVTRPYETALLLVNGSRVIWGGIVIKRERKLGGSGINLTLSTIEHYLDSVYIRDLSFSQAPQTQIAAGLVELTKPNGLYVKPDIGDSTIKRDRTYSETQNKTVLSALQELSDVINGPEWYGTWREIDRGVFQPTLIIRDVLGTYRANAVFEESTMTDFSLLEDYSTGYGANKVQATSSAEDGESPLSDWQTYDDPSRPTIEYKYQAGTSITKKDTLNGHAKSALETMKNGTTTVTFTSALTTSPQPGVDWDIGDIVNYRLLTAHDYYPDFDSGQARIIGYDVDYSQAWTLTPMLRPVATEREKSLIK